MIKKMDHIAIAVRSIEEALQAYHEALGLELTDVKEMPEDAVRVAFLPVGETKIELVEPLTVDSGVAKFLEKQGEGLHHICLEVEDIEAVLRDLRAKGIRLIDRQPRQGAHGRVAFLHPQSAHGVLIELIEKRGTEPHARQVKTAACRETVAGRPRRGMKCHGYEATTP